MSGDDTEVTEAGRLSPADDETRTRSVDEIIARAIELTRQLLAGRNGASVDDFLAERHLEAEQEG